jgi:antitoxin ParD1/3/4
MDISISLPPELVGLIEAKVASGRYRSRSDVVREALRLLDKVDQGNVAARGRLKQAWDEGVGSVDAGPLDFAALKEAARSRHNARKA